MSRSRTMPFDRAAKVLFTGTRCRDTSHIPWTRKMTVPGRVRLKRQTKRLWRLREPVAPGVNKPRCAFNYGHSGTRASTRVHLEGISVQRQTSLSRAPGSCAREVDIIFTSRSSSEARERTLGSQMRSFSPRLISGYRSSLSLPISQLGCQPATFARPAVITSPTLAPLFMLNKR